MQLTTVLITALLSRACGRTIRSNEVSLPSHPIEQSCSLLARSSHFLSLLCNQRHLDRPERAVLGMVHIAFNPPNLGAPYPMVWGMDAVKFETCNADVDNEIITEGKTYFPSCKPRGCIPEGGKSVDETLCKVRLDQSHPQFAFKVNHTYPTGCCLESVNCAPNCGPETCQYWYAYASLEQGEAPDREEFLEKYQCGEECPQNSCRGKRYQCKSMDCLECKKLNTTTGAIEFDNDGEDIYIPFFTSLDIQCMSTGTVAN